MIDTLLAETAKFHASLNVSDLGRSTAFYRVLFGREPAKSRPDYAKFELEAPPLVLSLILGRPASGGNLNHVGLRVTTSEELVRIQHRLELAGIATQREDGVECCYSKQTKFWVADPDHALWEIYVLHEETDEDCGHAIPEAGHAESFTSAVPSARVTWQHQLTEPVPTRIPRDDDSVHEVLLEGTANLPRSAAYLKPIIGEAFRVLRPGGEIRLHGLAADAPFPKAPLSLPGPAAAVQYVPTPAEPLDALRGAGFVELLFEKLSAKAYFEIAGIGLREILLCGRKPGYRPHASQHVAVYLGPMSQLRDDFGNQFPRGDRVMLNIHDWQRLRNGPMAGHFLLLAP